MFKARLISTWAPHGLKRQFSNRFKLLRHFPPFAQGVRGSRTNCNDPHIPNLWQKFAYTKCSVSSSSTNVRMADCALCSFFSNHGLSMVVFVAILRWAALAFSLSVRYLTKRRKWAVTSAEVPFVSCARRWRVSGAARTPSARATAMAWRSCDGKETDAARYGKSHEGLALQPYIRHGLYRNHDG